MKDKTMSLISGEGRYRCKILPENDDIATILSKEGTWTVYYNSINDMVYIAHGCNIGNSYPLDSCGFCGEETPKKLRELMKLIGD